MIELTKRMPKSVIVWVAFRDDRVVGIAHKQHQLNKWKHDREETYYCRRKDLERLQDRHLYDCAIKDPFVIAVARKVPKKRHTTKPVHKKDRVMIYMRNVRMDEECYRILQHAPNKQKFIRDAVKFYYEDVKRRQQEKMKLYGLC